MPAVIDTNVLIVANGRETHASVNCQIKCIETIQALKKNSGLNPIAIDDKGLILEEYSSYMNFHGQPGAGDFFYKFIHDQMYTDCSVITVQINQSIDPERGFEELPNNRLDSSDRKFLAVAVASKAEIFNATDSDWHENVDTLDALGIRLNQLCPEHAERCR